MSLVFVLVLVSLVTFCIYLNRHYNYWKRRGIDTPKYVYIFGNMWEQLAFRRNGAAIFRDAYDEFKGYNYFGFYNVMQRAIVVRNPDLVADMLVKDFPSFADNDFEIDENDAIFGRNPFVLKGQKWKEARSQSTPSFTPVKIKAMLPMIRETSTKLLIYMKDYENIPVDLNDLAKRITAENVASCAFGLEGRSFEKSASKFYEIASEPLAPSFWNTVKSIMVFSCPAFSHYFTLSFYSKKTLTDLIGIINDTMAFRAKNNVRRNDLLDEMKRINEKINDQRAFNMADIIGHAGGIILDGVLTSSAAASHTIYEIARNQEVQDVLRREIEDALENEELTFENIRNLEYLDCVLKEALRLHPPLLYFIRRVTKPYVLPPMREDNTGPSIQLDVGTSVIIPIWALHMDEKYFPEPETFNPDRWRGANKDDIVKHAYLPFSAGPRACLGTRFAVLQIKVALITLIQNYRILLSDKTQESVDIDPVSFVKAPIGGHWAQFRKLS